MYLRTRAHLRRVVRQDPRNFSLSSRLSLSLSTSLPCSPCFSYPPALFFSSLSLPWLLCYLNGPCLIASLESTAKPSSLLLCNESGITARRELSKFIRPMRSRRYESPLDRPTRNFIRYTPGRPRRMLRGISGNRGNARALTSITTGLSPRSEELRHHIVVARVSAATSTLPLNRPSGEPATTPGTKALLPSPARSGYPPAETTLQGASIYVHC